MEAKGQETEQTGDNEIIISFNAITRDFPCIPIPNDSSVMEAFFEGLGKILPPFLPLPPFLRVGIILFICVQASLQLCLQELPILVVTVGAITYTYCSSYLQAFYTQN